MTIRLLETTITRNTAAVTQFVATFSKPNPGDLLKVQLLTNGNAVLAVPAGWVLRYANETYPAKFYVYYRICDGTEGTSAAWTLGPAAERNAGSCQRFSGVDPKSPWDTGDSVLVSNAIANTIVIPAIKVPSAGAMILSGAGADITAATLTPPPDIIEDDDSGGTGTKMQATGHFYTPVPITFGPISWGISASPTARTGWLGALRPALSPESLTASRTTEAANTGPVQATLGADGPIVVELT